MLEILKIIVVLFMNIIVFFTIFSCFIMVCIVFIKLSYYSYVIGKDILKEFKK